MKFAFCTIAALAAATSTQALSLRSTEMIQEAIQNNLSRRGGARGSAGGSGSGNRNVCGSGSHKTPIDLWSDIATDSAPAVKHKQCNDPSGFTRLERVGENHGGDCSCRGKFFAEAELDCCCASEDRELKFKYDVNHDKPPTKIVINVYENEECEALDCCDQCLCYGDPHCVSFADNKYNPGHIQRSTFAPCDIRDIPDPSDPFGVQCGNQAGRAVANSNKYKSRCMGTANGYEYNDGLCQWMPDEIRGYDFKNHGGPCQPKESHPVTSMKMVEGPDQDIVLNVGERGAITTVEIGTGAQMLSLDAKNSCFDWSVATNGVVSVFSQKEGSINNKWALKRTDIATTNEEGTEYIADVWWEVENKEDKSRVAIKCYGATVAVGGVPNTEVGEAMFNTHREIASGSRSSRPNTHTRLDVAYYENQVSSTGGFCIDGQFAENAALYGTTEDPFLKCSMKVVLETPDVQELLQMPTCLALLEEYECTNYDHESKVKNNGPAKTNREYFLDIMEKCVETMCESMPYATPNANGYIAPPGSDKHQCKSDVFDFGVRFVRHMYSSTITPSGDECLPSVSVTIDGTPVDVVNGEIVLKLGEDYECDTVPTNIVIRQQTCADQCDGANKIRATVSAVTGYEEFLSIFDEDNGKDVKVIVDGEEIELPSQNQLNDQWCV